MVRKDEKASIIIYWNQKTVEEEITNDKNEKDTIEKKLSLLRYYNVFNIEQTEGIPKAEFNNNNEIATCEEIILNMKDKAEIRFEGDPSYNPTEDYISMPEIRNFNSSESFYSVLFHELMHWTGNKKRLNRFNNESLRFGSTSYSKEELVAELGSSFLCHIAGIEKEVVENHASYIDNWLNVLESDKRLIVYAGRLAQKGVNYILGRSGEEE